MRYKYHKTPKAVPKPGSTRIRRGFAWVPKLVRGDGGDVWVWLEFIHFHYRYRWVGGYIDNFYNSSPHLKWVCNYATFDGEEDDE